MINDCVAFDRDSHFSEYCDTIMKVLQFICKSLVYKRSDLHAASWSLFIKHTLPHNVFYALWAYHKSSMMAILSLKNDLMWCWEMTNTLLEWSAWMAITITMMIFETMIIMISLKMRNDKYFVGVVGLNDNYVDNDDF